MFSLSYPTRLVLIVLVLCSGFLSLPAAADPISAYISTEPSSVTHMTAAEYESQGIALMNEAEWSGLLSLTDEGLAFYPGNAELYCLKGYVLRKTGHYREAVDNVTIAIGLDPKPIRYVNRGFALLALERSNDALNDADTAISLNSSCSAAYGVKALALMSTGNESGALQEIDTAILLNPSDPFYWHTKGKILAASGNCSGAIDALNRSIANNPDYNLPWPGFGNATTDLKRVEAQCQPEDARPAPTKAPLAVWITIAGLLLAITFRRLQ